MFAKIKNLIGDRLQSSIKYKLFFIYVLVISIPIITFGIISYCMVASSVKNDFIHYKESLNTQIINNIDQNIHTLIQQSRSAYMMLDDMNLILSTPLSQADTKFYDANRRMENYMWGVLSGDDMINGIALIDVSGEVRDSYDRNQSPTLSFVVQDSKWFKDTIALNGTPLIREPHLNEFYDSTPDHKNATSVISICRSITDLGKQNGVFVIDESTDNFIKTSLNVETEPGETFILYGKSGEVIYSNSKLTDQQYNSIWSQTQAKSQGSVKYMLNRQNTILNFSTSNTLGWKVISLLPVSQLQKKVQFLNNINLILFIISVVLIVVISILVSNLITIPLNKLMASFIKLQKGDFTAHVEVTGKDEFAQIGETFNNMVVEIQNLISQKYELDILRKQAELDSLQSQINPHFLFNTLSSIREVAINGDNQKSAEMLQSLSDIFRYNLNKERYEVKFYEELEHLKRYLYLQKSRFGNRYNIIYDIDNNVMNCNILRFTLQPIVENALYHGLDVKRGNGKLIITAMIIDDKYSVYIWDNGAGIPEDELNNINNLLEGSPETFKDSYKGKNGMYNVNARIKLHYGTEYGLKIQSTFGSDTTVKITLPLYSKS